MFEKWGNNRIKEKIALFCRDGLIPEFSPYALEDEKTIEGSLINIVNGAMTNAFPETHQALGEVPWSIIIEDFYNKHTPSDFKFYSLPFDFYIFTTENDYDRIFGKPYLDDLVYYEWIKLDVQTSFDTLNIQYNIRGNILRDIPLLNPHHHLIQLSYPINSVNVDDSLLKQGHYFILIYRDPVDGSVKEFNLNVIEALIIERLESSANSIEEILDEAYDIYPDFDKEISIEDIKNFILHMVDIRAILGFYK